MVGKSRAVVLSFKFTPEALRLTKEHVRKCTPRRTVLVHSLFCSLCIKNILFSYLDPKIFEEVHCTGLHFVCYFY